MRINDQNEKQIYNSRTIDPYLKLFKARYPGVDVEHLLRYANIELWEVADQSHWFTQTQINRFYERAVQLTGNEQLAEEAGRFVVSPETFGFMRAYALSFIDPHTMFERIGDVSSQLTRSSTYSSRKIDNNKVEINVTLNEGIKEEPFQCENRLGLMAAAIENFNYKLSSIDHPECIFKGGDACRYVIRWEVTKAYRIRRLRNISAAVLPLMNIPVAIFSPMTLVASIPASVAFYAALSWKVAKAEHQELVSSMGHMTDLRDQLMEQLDANYNNAMLTSEIGVAISSLDSIDHVLKSVVNVLSNRLDFDRGLILLANEEKTRLNYRAGFGHEDEHRLILERATFHLDNPDSRGVFVEAFKDQKAFLVDDFESFERRHSVHSVNVAKSLGVKSFVCCPIICEGESLGVLAVDNLKSSRSLMQRDKSLLTGIAPVIGVALKNAEHLLAKDREFRSTLQVLAASIDARDPLTAGHSEKVTELSVGICNAMELDVTFRECVRVASLLHDYGKIGVPDAILKKDGRLNQEEYEIIKTHSNKTRDILSQINFEGKYKDVPEIAGSHHEKWDGQGYPDGLVGENIHLGARIVAVADFFEAVTSKRHYRDPMPTDVAVKLILEQSGTAFDPVVVDAFLRYLDKVEETKPQDREGGDGGGDKVCVLRNTRVPVKAPAEIKTEQSSIQGQVHDVSVSGAYLSVPEDMDEGLMIRVTLKLPGYDRPLEAAGRIAWINSGDRRPKPHFPEGIGVEFTAFNESCEADLKDYIQLNHPEFKHQSSLH